MCSFFFLFFFLFYFFFNDTATTEIYTLSLHELFRSYKRQRRRQTHISLYFRKWRHIQPINMGFDIPEPYVWDESFKVFYEQLDKEHQGLFQGIFACAAARSDAGKLASLTKLVKEHFSYEEGQMSKAGYSDLASHAKIHAEFVTKLENLSCPLDDATINFAKDWLVQHIKGIDFKYKGKLG